MTTNSLFVIRWPIGTQGTYSFGSKIKYGVGNVMFTNIRISPGEKIHTWSSKHPYELQASYLSQLPLLKAKQKYKVIMNAKVDPKGSVQIQVEFFDIRNELISRPVNLDPSGIFTVPEGMDHYQLNLINLNNTNLIFENLVITPENEPFKCATYSDSIKMRMVWNEQVKTFKRVRVYLRDRSLNTGSYVGKDEEIRIYIELDSYILKQSNRLEEALDKGIDSFRSQVKKEKFTFDTLTTNITLLSEPSEVLEQSAEIISKKLTKILHYYRN